MKKIFLCLFSFISLKIYALGLGASLTLAAGPSGSVYLVEQMRSGSLIVTNYSGSSIAITNIVPYSFVTGNGESLVSWAPPTFDLHTANGAIVSPWSTTGFGGQISGNPTIGASAIYFPFPAVFHIPSLRPAYSGNSLIAAGTQTFVMGASVYGADGSQVSSELKVEVDPIPLPGAEVSGVTGW